MKKNKDKVDMIRKLAFNKPYYWLFLNFKSQRIYKEWDEIIFDDKDEEVIELKNNLIINLKI